jgi:hypothetical protein
MRKLPAPYIVALCMLFVISGFSVLNAPAEAQSKGKIAISRIEYRRWPESVLLSNGQIEVVIAPAIGRVMQMRFRGDEEGPFWENAELAGHRPDPASKTWGNFGGDKTWPAPQADWPKITPRAWPPPAAFDSMPVTVEIKGDVVELVTPIDAHFGVRARRVVRLDPKRPSMTITTTYEKVEGEPRTIGVWIITQLKDPERVFIPLPAKTLTPEGYNRQSKELPANLQRSGSMLSLTRDPKLSTKIGSEAGALLWIGEKHSLRIDSPRVAGATYPDQSSSGEVYTNPDPLKYVELEMLGPVSTMKVGDRIERSNTYTLFRRGSGTAEEEAKRLLSIK